MKQQLSLLIVTALVAISGCAKSNPQNKIAGTVTNMGAKTTQPTGEVSSFQGYACANPISMEEAGREAITDVAQLPKGKFKIEKIQTHIELERNGGSFNATADGNGVRAEVTCNGMIGAAASGEQSNTFRATSGFDVVGKLSSGFQKYIRVSFKDGQVSSSESGLQYDHRRDTFLENIPVGRVKVGDWYATVRFYVMDEGRILTKVHFEFPEGQGKFTHIYGEAEYVKAEE